MKHALALVSALWIILLTTGSTALAQSSATTDEIMSRAIEEKIKVEEEKFGKKLTRYEETQIEREEAFLAAVGAGDLEGAKEKLAAPYLYAYDPEGELALTRAIKNRDVEMVRFLEEKAVINLPNKEGETPLLLAIQSGDPEILDIIMKRASPSVQDAQGISPVMAALEKDDMDLVLELVVKGADLDQKSMGVTPLYRVVEMNRTDLAAMLTHYGANPSIAAEEGEIPLHRAVQTGNSIMTGILLQKSGRAAEDANWKTRKGEPLLNIAIENGHDQVARLLLDFGAVTYQTDYLENTALNLAAEKGDAELVRILLDRGADPNHRNIVGETPIITAARGGYQQITDILAEAGANADARSYDGRTAAGQYDRSEQLTDPKIMEAVAEMTGGDN